MRTHWNEDRRIIQPARPAASRRAHGTETLHALARRDRSHALRRRLGDDHPGIVQHRFCNLDNLLLTNFQRRDD